jgi:hypothetical protein
MKIELLDTTFVIPIRIDSLERIENLSILFSYFRNLISTNLIILEADKMQIGLSGIGPLDNLSYTFEKDDDVVFHRTKYLNTLSQMVKTEYIAVWDSDVIVPPSQIQYAISKLRDDSHDFLFPYDGRFLDTGVRHRINFMQSGKIEYLLENAESMSLPYTNTACGGGFFARLSDYLECGGENENFYGWGQEDGERVKRWQILEKRVLRVKGPMFHLYHPRGTNSGYLSEEHRQAQIAEFYRISGLSRTDLLSEIAEWKVSRTNV